VDWWLLAKYHGCRELGIRVEPFIISFERSVPGLREHASRAADKARTLGLLGREAHDCGREYLTPWPINARGDAHAAQLFRSAGSWQLR
jgi:hypothetical protein